jgi:hypothetical protein
MPMAVLVWLANPVFVGIPVVVTVMLRNRLFGYPELPPHGEGHKIIVRLNR